MRSRGTTEPSIQQPTADPGLFGPDSVTWRVHGDPSMLLAGFRALLLQATHPLVMAGFDDNSFFRGDPWGRLARTSTFLAVTTFGPADDAQRAVDKVRGIHRRVRGTAPDGRAYEAGDPHLLEWVHIAEIDSVLRAHQRRGGDEIVGACRSEHERPRADHVLADAHGGQGLAAGRRLPGRGAS